MSGNDVAHLIEDIDGYLCELGMAQIRDGLHVLGEMPPLPEMLRALTRLSNPGVPGLQEAMADSVGYRLAVLLENPGARLEGRLEFGGVECLLSCRRLRTVRCPGEASLFGSGGQSASSRARSPRFNEWSWVMTHRRSHRVLEFACSEIVPNLERSSEEIDNLLNALEGRYVPAGPAGAPTRGMAHILPTGRNFYAVDPRALPSQAAWRVGQQLAKEAIERYVREEGRYPEMVGLTAWGTSQMRTHGDDIAEAFALAGSRADLERAVPPTGRSHSNSFRSARPAPDRCDAENQRLLPRRVSASHPVVR